MNQAGEDLPLGAKTLYDFGGVEAGADELERDLLAILLVVALGQVDVAHAALADQLFEAVGSDASAEQRLRSHRLDGLFF